MEKGQSLFHNGTLSNSDGEDPVDYPVLRDSPMELYVVATDDETGAPIYFDKSDMAQDDYDILKASSALQRGRGVCRAACAGGACAHSLPGRHLRRGYPDP